MGAFGLNSIISLVVIFNNYLSDKTITVLITNLLFLSFKIKDVFAVVNTDKNIFLSSYLTRKIQFNDIDPDHIYTALCSDIESADLTDSPSIKSTDTNLTDNPSNELPTHPAAITINIPTPPITPPITPTITPTNEPISAPPTTPIVNIEPLIIPNPT